MPDSTLGKLRWYLWYERRVPNTKGGGTHLRSSFESWDTREAAERELESAKSKYDLTQWIVIEGKSIIDEFPT